jgi:hypothetical protein
MAGRHYRNGTRRRALNKNLRTEEFFFSRRVSLLEEGRQRRMITSEQVGATRRLLGWSQARLAGHSALSENTVAKFGTGAQRLPSPNLDAIRQVLEVAGVGFTNAGVLSVKLGAALAAKA